MNQETTQIRQDIETTREALTQKLTMLEERARSAVQNAKETVQQATDVNHHVDQRPWTTMGIAVLTGYVAGRLFSSDSDKKQPGSAGSSGRFQEELSLIKGAAMGAVFGLLSDLLRQALPHLGAYLRTNEPQSVIVHSTDNIGQKDNSMKRRDSSLKFPLTPVP